MIVTLTLIAVVAAVLVPLIHRDLVRARARHMVTARITIDTTHVLAALRRASRATAELDTAMRQVGRGVMAEASDRLKAARPDRKNTVI